jgi:hypothetical protein
MTPSPAQDHSRTEGLREAAEKLLAQFDAFRESDHSHADAHSLLVRYELWEALRLSLLTPSQSHDEEDARPELPSGMGPSDLDAGRSAECAGGFTPGPWRLCDGDRTGFKTASGGASVLAPARPSDDFFILKIAEMDTNVPPAEALANARLIAAAPDLLEALQAVLGFPTGLSGGGIYTRARAAIAKALGKEEPE